MGDTLHLAVSGGAAQPINVGQQTAANSIPVVLASDQAVVTGAATSANQAVLTPVTAELNPISIASSASTGTIVALNTSRHGLTLSNTDANEFYGYYGATATLTKFTFRIPPGGYWEMPQPIYTGKIDGIWSAAGSGKIIGSEY